MIHCGNKIKNFKRDEFPEDVHKYADFYLMRSLQSTRDCLGEKIYPSKAEGALARFKYHDAETGLVHDTTKIRYLDFFELFKKNPSNHFVFLDKKSSAIDIFCDCLPFKAFLKILEVRLWSGIGVYFDTVGPDGLPHVMFHLDFGRKKQLMWYRLRGQYHYQDEQDFYQRMQNLLFYRAR